MKAQPPHLGIVISFQHDVTGELSEQVVPLFNIGYKTGTYKDLLDNIRGRNALQLPQGAALQATKELQKAAPRISHEAAALVFWNAFLWFGKAMKSLNQQFDPEAGIFIH